MSDDSRPDPDALLARVQREEKKRRRGRLKVFFGASAGVGKTYGMLLAAREKRAEGVDVVIGVVETHGRADTAALLEGLEILPQRAVDYRGAKLSEFDLDAALKRRPAVIVVDELAHSNAEGSRHPKRWQDVEELLDAGIDVYTALNVQHLESLNDVVGGITGVRVYETVPDTAFDHADEVELIDLPPDELIERLNEGKVYLPEQAKAAIQNFFRKGNLIALRELSLRRTAERVEEQMRVYREDQGIRAVWQAGDLVLVCIGPGELAERLVRAGRRFAAALHADWIVAYIETPQLQRLPAEQRDAVMQDLRLAESLGATTVTLGAPQMSAAILEYAREKNVTKILLGKPTRKGWRRWLLGSVVDTVVREAEDIDVYLLGGERRTPGETPVIARSRAYLGLPEADRGKARWPRYAIAAAVPAFFTGVGLLVSGPNELVNLVMLYLLGVMLVATRFGRGPSLLASVLSVGAFDFVFVPPEFTFAVSDVRYVVTFAVMLLVGVVISTLAANLRTQARVAGYREKRAASLYTISRALAAANSEDEIVRAAAGNIGAEFGAQCSILFPNAAGRIVYPRGESQSYSLHGADLGVAQWVFDHGRVAGHGTDTLPGADAVYYPIQGASGPLGVLALLPSSLRRVFLPEQQRLLGTFLNQVALALERVRLAEAAQSAQIKVETESLRNSLLAGISHDLRTPLSAIVGAASSLAEEPERLSEEARRELARTIYDEGQRMATLANNILDMARLDAGAVTLKREWVPLEEIVGGVLTRLRARLGGRPVRIALPKDAPLVKLDAVLIEQVLVNLLENALKYTPAGTAIEISAEFAPGAVTVSVVDEGPGIPAGLEERLFDKFFRASPERAQSGVGLGLTICRAIVEAHGGRIRAENRFPHGAAFRFTLPRDEAPPAIEGEEMQARSA
ncbi:MAG TPA: sensor histidine kinase KdpD [Burkholderiales bacterium]|nr:sensor histidine kinase KdpD [Burkholderiales bacterium]